MQDALGAVQSVLVLGAGSDIARSTLRELVARRTRTVVLAARDPEALTPLADELRTEGARRIERLPFDARAVEAHDAFVDDAFARAGEIDVALLAFGVLGDQQEAE